MMRAVLLLALFLAGCGRDEAPSPAPPGSAEQTAIPLDTARVIRTVATERDSLLLSRVVAGHTVQVRGWPGGYEPHHLLVNGREVWGDEMELMEIDTVLTARGGGALVVWRVVPGGTACEAMFRVLELPPDHRAPRITDQFGTCSWESVVSYRRDRLRIFMGGWLPMRLALLDTLPPDVTWPDDELYEYRNGRMKRIATGERAGRLAGLKTAP